MNAGGLRRGNLCVAVCTYVSNVKPVVPYPVPLTHRVRACEMPKVGRFFGGLLSLLLLRHVLKLPKYGTLNYKTPQLVSQLFSLREEEEEKHYVSF